MKKILILSLLLPVLLSAQASWSEYPVACDSISIFITGITDDGHLIGCNPWSKKCYYSEDLGETWKPVCINNVFHNLVQVEGFSDYDFLYNLRSTLYGVDLENSSCSLLFSDNALYTIRDALVLEPENKILITDNQDLYFYDLSGSELASYTLASNTSIPTIHYQRGYPSYVTYRNNINTATALREIDIQNNLIGPEVTIPGSFNENEFLYSNGILYASFGRSLDGGISWNNYSGINSNTEIVEFKVSGDIVFILTDTQSYYSTDRGETFSVTTHSLTFSNAANIIGDIHVEPGQIIMSGAIRNGSLAISSDQGETWTMKNPSTGIVHNQSIIAAQNQKLFSQTECGYDQYDQSSNVWSEFNQEGFWDIKVLPNDNLLFVDWDGYYLSQDLGATWSFHSLDLSEMNFGPSVFKDGIVYFGVVDRGGIAYSEDNGLSSSYWEVTFRSTIWDYFNDHTAIGLEESSTGSYNFYWGDLKTDEKISLSKTFDLETHVSLTTAWSGAKVYIVEYSDNSKTNLLLQSSNDNGQNFTSTTLPFFLNAGNINFVTDPNENLIIYDSKQLFISQDEGISWIELTPDTNGFQSITDMAVSFDDCLYLSTFGTSILRYDCKLNQDLNACTTSLIDNDEDGFVGADDCDDNNPNVNPDQIEAPYNGIDDDCNPITLDDDLDQDGFVFVDDCDDNNPNINPNQTEEPYNDIDDDCNPTTLDDDLDQDGYNLIDDCDDNVSSINPGAVEILDNGIDEDCDGMDATAAVDSDGDGFLSDVDCDDNDPLINPDATETCNAIDDNCNGVVDEGLIVQRYYEDADGDGYGGTGNSLVDCQPPNGFVALQGDCNDSNASIFPGQTETPYNDVDDDCDPATLDDDLDGDGFLMANDCDDNNPDVNSAQMEVPYNGVDDDCDPISLDDDLDQDGFALADDCDDDNASINPNQEEEPYNGIDDDCNSTTLDDDLDEDGFVLVDDCNDNNPNINPAQTEEPYNGIDDDCDSATPDDDLDEDGFLMADDCDDNNSNINPDAEEIPNNGIDEDCDGMDLISATYEIAEAKVNIYPNPAIDIIKIDVMGQLDYQVSLYDLAGKLMMSSTNLSQIKIESIPTGTYLLQIKDLETRKKIVERIVIGR